MVDEPSRALVAQGPRACLAEMMVDITDMTERRDCAPAGYWTGSCLSPRRAVQGRGKVLICVSKTEERGWRSQFWGVCILMR